MNQSISNTYLSLSKSKYTLNEMKKLLKSDLEPGYSTKVKENVKIYKIVFLIKCKSFIKNLLKK